MSATNSTNGTTIAPEVAAFVSNSKQLIIAGSVTGGAIVLLIAIIIICCRCIRNRTSDEAKERNRIERKNNFENRKAALAEDEAKREARQKRNAGKVRRGRVAAYDEVLAKSFANLTGFGKRKPVKDEDDISDDDDEIRSDEEREPSPQRLVKSESVRSPSEVGDGNSSSPTSARPRAMSRTRTLSLMSGTSGGADDAVTVTVDHVVDDDTNAEGSGVDLSGLASPVVARNSGPFVLSGVRRLPMPRSAKAAEVLYSHRHSLFDAVIQSHLVDEQKRLDAVKAAQDELAARRRKAAEARALDALQVHAALRSTSSFAPPVIIHEVDDEATLKRQRLTTVPADDYFGVNL